MQQMDHGKNRSDCSNQQQLNPQFPRQNIKELHQICTLWPSIIFHNANQGFREGKDFASVQHVELDLLWSCRHAVDLPIQIYQLFNRTEFRILKIM